MNLQSVSLFSFLLPLLALFLLNIIPPVTAGPIAYASCQAGCAGIVMACYSAAGFTWGATLGVTAPASIVACNAAFGTCYAACAGFLVAPIPGSERYVLRGEWDSKGNCFDLGLRVGLRMMLLIARGRMIN
ncbi:hypothetical protein EYC80_001377 [Monilinia laxa]|uniref:Uncharacterized protein n=1 Tax=Monilinia laxa TaxID=61186 RepID=A0A5N6KA13_MONLA|nr:hypothetical protein EYC80_001377 [Monilinia laxa]